MHNAKKVILDVAKEYEELTVPQIRLHREVQDGRCRVCHGHHRLLCRHC